MRYFFFLISFFLFLQIHAQNIDQPDPLNYLQNSSVSDGEKLFRANCAKCHELCDQQLGPALTDVMYKRPFPWLVKFIQNSDEVIASGDSYANHLYEAYNSMEMPNFPDLDEKDIKNILGYLKSESDKARKDTSITSTSALSSLIKSARNRSYNEEQGVKDYYAETTDLRVPVDEASALRGKTLFRKHCNSCHELCKSTIGPALSGISKRRPLPWLLSFINNPMEVVKTNDNYTNYLVSNYNFVMPQFSFITDEQKLDILAYIRSETASEVSSSGANSQNIAEKAVRSTEETKQLDSDSKYQRDDAKEIDHQKAFETSTIVVLVLFFAVVGFFAVRYFRK